jgi:hypothetical protein
MRRWPFSPGFVARVAWTVAGIVASVPAGGEVSSPNVDTSELVSSMPDADVPDLQVTSYLGIHALNGQNAALGIRVGFRYRKKRDLYLGPEVWIAPLSRSSVVYTVFTTEQSVVLTDDGRITGGACIWAGLGFPQGIPGAGAQEIAIGSEFFVTRRLDDLARLRLMARGGYLAGRFMGLGGLGVAFRL